MDLIPCSGDTRQTLVNQLFPKGYLIDKKWAEFVASSFPDILLDVARLLAEQATSNARQANVDPNLATQEQFKPFFMFEFMLGKCPQTTSFIYSYFKYSSFQPLPENLFRHDSATKTIVYNYPGFNDELTRLTLYSLFKYLTFDPKWFSSAWNWGELGRFITIHSDPDIRYIAGCCLSLITKPTRLQHTAFMSNVIGFHQNLVEQQIKHRHIFENTFKPCLQTNEKIAKDFVQSFGPSSTGYTYDKNFFTKFGNVLLLKRSLNNEQDTPEMRDLYAKEIGRYVPVKTVTESISKIAYSISINKPSLLRGSSGSGKTALLNYIAAHTNRLDTPDFVSIQIGDQIDSKLLIGSYICTEIPGQFEWQPGPLTKAMMHGSWIVFEDIDSAPADMLQVIHSVIENGNLSCVSCCPVKIDRPHPDFRIFFTQQINGQATISNTIGHGFVEKLCDVVELPDLDDDDLKDILESKYKLFHLSTTLIQLFRQAQHYLRDINEQKGTRAITLRELFKLCDRIQASSLNTNDNEYSSSDLELIFLDAFDCFLSSLSNDDNLKAGVEKLGSVLNIPTNLAEQLALTRTPELREASRSFTIGRVTMTCANTDADQESRPKSHMAYTRQSLKLMESVSACVKHLEPVLLVGETGVGKTSIIQHIANMMNTELVVINLSQQSDSSDLLGGYKPVEYRELMRPLHEQFEKLFAETFDTTSNKKFLDHVNACYINKRKNQWRVYLKLILNMCHRANKLKQGWKELQDKAQAFLNRISQNKEQSSMALSFAEGSLLKAMRNGQWILLDEINLAEPDVLQCLMTLLDSLNKSKVHLNTPNEKSKPLQLHPNFRVFACMNPSTDIGKRDLTTATRGRFTEFYVDDILEPSDLRLIVESYTKTCLSAMQIENIVRFYREVRARRNIFTDISGNTPVYSLRTLCRALDICASNVCHNMEKSLFESMRITFLQQLDKASTFQMIKLMEQEVFKKATSGLDIMKVQRPKDSQQYVEVGGFWVQQSDDEVSIVDDYVLTSSVERNLQNLARIISLGQRKLPILIQGDTSVGKTSLIKYLASITGNRCYRINNHEHTDLQDYVGRYVLKEDGEFEFQDGLLVKAMKNGYWIILDELNLAPCELLEALNRVLDDNRELFIPETRVTVKAHSKFMLFATQNPPEKYQGRKFLSRAFRNRFIELHFDEIPNSELEYILHKKCEMPTKYAEKIVTVMRELQLNRRESECFNGKGGFMTLRDLFRWGERYAIFKRDINDFHDWETHIAEEGLILLEGRVRTSNEAETVKSIIEKVFKCKLDRDKIYGKEHKLKSHELPIGFQHICFTKEFQRLFVQLTHALKYKEPVLLCGQTGCGKTTACQLYAAIKQLDLMTYNCHLNTESSDFIGEVRPMRKQVVEDEPTKQVFPWVNGPLVEAMKKGVVFLMDEISLADDAVLERINSVLEPSRSITLIEKNGEEIYANDQFRLVATMNPGGDYGKKELSPALRNRFTEIYCHNTTDFSQITDLISGCLSRPLMSPKLMPNILTVMIEFLKDYYKSSQDNISIRDLSSWCNFLNKTTNPLHTASPLSIQESLIEGVSLVYFDQFGTCGHKALNIGSGGEFNKAMFKSRLSQVIAQKFGPEPIQPQQKIDTNTSTTTTTTDKRDNIVMFKNYCVTKGKAKSGEVELNFVTNTPTVAKNIRKIVRAMQLDRPILLEGDPGAGKTSVVEALAKLTNHELVRINLSEQTDLSDLFGCDLPSTEETADGSPSFCWHDGPMISAFRQNQWILLDEMNLASQSVLEGLNACLDHRGEIYIPELNKRIIIDRSKSRIFACQNPYNQGAARKGLPQSFLNRFTSIYIESHNEKDMNIIIQQLYKNLPGELIAKMVEFNTLIGKLPSICNYSYEFNLRDILYWCDLVTRYVQGPKYKELNLYRPERFVQFVYLDRMRNPVLQMKEIAELFERIFGCPIYMPLYHDIRLGEQTFMIARAILPRKMRLPPQLPEYCILKYQLPYIESVAKAIEHNKMPIIVGESGSGKRSIAKIVASLTGNEMSVICANSEMDTVELLGSFEQKNFQREVMDLVEEAKDFFMEIMNTISKKEFASTWTRVFNKIWSILYDTSNCKLGDFSRDEMANAFQFQLKELSDLIEKIQPLSEYMIEKRCLIFRAKIKRLIRMISNNEDLTYSSGNFEWIESVLIKAVREGKWLLIEDANMMNPATLDRLNSLVEPNGTLSLNEKGSGPDGVELLRPHPDFRLILTMDPEHGELSRAMRNRGVEIYVQTNFFFEDFLMLLNQNGFKQEEGKTCMAYCVMQTSFDTHKKIIGEEGESEEALTLPILAYFGLNYVTTLAHQVRRKVKIDDILADLLISYYSRRGFSEQCADPALRSFIMEKMKFYEQRFAVSLDCDRYKWKNLIHDLPSITGGDAFPTMIDRDNKIFFESCIVDLILAPEEIIENIDFVNAAITLKIFLDLATHGDFEYRKGFIRETFAQIQPLVNTISNRAEFLHCEYSGLIKRLLPNSDYVPAEEILVDSRNAPDLQYHLQSIDYEATAKREREQNRWLLSLHRIMLQIITELTEERSSAIEGYTSLWSQSDKVRMGQMLKEDLVRPTAEIAVDLYDFFDGILYMTGNRSLDNKTTAKTLSRFFWINYFICKLRRAHNKEELVAVCNQIPMLWALTYQKVIVPLIKDCNMADVSFKNKKFSTRIQHICDFLDVNMAKPGHVEKEYYHKVVNPYATTSKKFELIQREVDKFFATMIARYTSRTKALSTSSTFDQNMETIATASMIWSNSTYMSMFYDIEDKLVTKISVNQPFISPESNQAFNEAKVDIGGKRKEYETHEECLKDERYRTKCLNANRRMNAMDQFSPVWQLNFIHIDLAKLLPTISDPEKRRLRLRQMLFAINGLIFSPKYYSTLLRYLLKLEERVQDGRSYDLENINMYGCQLVDHLLENQVFDHHIVGWTKLRVTTSDLPALAPLIPEYSPIISLVSSFCLDISHLKLNSYLTSSPQLDAMLIYLCRHYVPIKMEHHKNTQDLSLAQNLIHLRCKVEKDRTRLVGKHVCDENLDTCYCVDVYIEKRLKGYKDMIRTIKSKMHKSDHYAIIKSLRLIYYGYLNYLEYAPIFSLDPSLRAREKLEVYRSELAHIKLELHFRNTLFYWKTGENLTLNTETDTDVVAFYPYSVRVLVERRIKLERSIKRLSQEHTNRPKSDDGTLYYELRREVETNIQRYSASIHAISRELAAYVHCKGPPTVKDAKFQNLITRCRMLIKNLERTTSKFRSQYELYSDLITNFQVGMCFVKQGLRCLYSKLEQKMQIRELGYTCDTLKYISDIRRVFSFNNFSRGTMESISRKLEFFPRIEKVCPPEKVNEIESILLKTVLMQLNHHIVMTPSDIKTCIPVVRRIADSFHSSWLVRKRRLEEQRKKHEELYQYKTSRTALGGEISYDRQEFIDVCSKFPTYDHIYESHFSMPPTSADKENLITEGRVCNLERQVDVRMCIDICKAHYKFFKEASQNLLEATGCRQLSSIDLTPMVKLEAETLYTIVRHCVPTLDQSFDSFSLECHLLQANELIKTLRQFKTTQSQVSSLEQLEYTSIDTLDENVFDIYYDPCAHEALKFHEFMHNVDSKIKYLRGLPDRDFDSHPTLLDILKLIKRISSFLITDPLMKFITGSHTLLEKLGSWNALGLRKEEKMITEADELEDLIKTWRALEVESWRNSLHKVKRKYIDSTLCDLWFNLYEAFSDPIEFVTKYIYNNTDDMENRDSFVLNEETSEMLYQVFVHFIKTFIEESTLGDYQIRLDLVFSFAIQTRFASFYEQELAKVATSPEQQGSEEEQKQQPLKVDYEKLFTYVYNTYRQYQGLLEPIKKDIRLEESQLSKELNTEIRIVSWQGRNLWALKNNFRISHRKLNKVMNKYLELLRRPLPSLNPVAHMSSGQKSVGEMDDEHNETARLARVLAKVRVLVEETPTPVESESSKLKSLRQATKVVEIFKKLYSKTFEPMSQRFLNNLITLEDTITDNFEAIHNFNSHRVQEVVFNRGDSKETVAEKHKLCRQMYNSKKFSMQSVFKTLHNLGASYRRGLNRRDHLDLYILSLEPLRGMIQNQSRSVLEGTQELIEDSLIVTCNQMYRKLIASVMTLLNMPGNEDLNEDQMERIRGLTLDMTFDILKLNKSAAVIFRNMMQIQAATTRLAQLQKASTAVVYNFSRVHKAVQRFNHLVGRVFMALAKLEKLSECYATAVELEDQAEETITTPATLPHYRIEGSMLKELICEQDEKHAMMTRKQHKHIQTHLGETRKSIASVSDQLRDMLYHTNSNYLYSQDDIDQLQELYTQFVNAFTQLLNHVDEEEGEVVVDEDLNLQKGTVLDALSILLTEAVEKLQPMLTTEFLSGDSEMVDLMHHPNLERLNFRLHKLVKYTKLAAQSVYKQEELWTSEESALEKLSATSRRNLKPFNYIDSDMIVRHLGAEQVAKYTSDCFRTLNKEDFTTDIDFIVTNLTPILNIYSQEVANYLNIILTSLYLKLTSADQLIAFFTDLLLNGFGLPFKPTEESGNEQEAKGKLSEDNAGFGEGQGSEDVSKKIEFESQLDDLKKNQPEDESKKEEGDEENVEAHDDGIEMTEDIDSKAQGPEEKSGDDNKEPEDEEQDDQEGLDELDKEMDTVDEEENKLDDKLWGDDEEKLDEGEEDDEQDLRETESGMEQREDNKQLEAKNDELTKSEDRADLATDGENDDNEDGDDDDDSQDGVTQDENDEINVPSSMDQEHEEEFEAELDLDQEASEALQEAPQADEAANDEEEAAHEDMLPEDKADDDMDISDDSNNQVDKVDGEEEEEGGKDPEETAADPVVEDSSANPEVEAKSEELVSKSDEQGDGVEANKDEKSRAGGEADSKENEDEKKGGAVDPLSVGIENVTDTEEPQSDDGNDDDGKSSKRTFAQVMDESEVSQIKRQKILAGVEDKDEDKPTQGDLKESDQVRHVDEEDAKKGTLEVIDLVSSDEEDEHILKHLDDVQQEQGSQNDKSSEDDENADKIIKEIDQQLKEKEAAEQDSVDSDKLISLWIECTKSTHHLVHELCQQLQIVLQPTKMSKYRGDYKSGKRLNMRKIISYIASNYRKDKIWLRRTKPSKRTYNITIAVDNSSSMSENNCRQMTYQSLALLAKSLSIIEAGSMSVISFGQQVRCIHEFDQPYMDAIGAQWLRELRFNESRTSYKDLLGYSEQHFAKQSSSTASQHGAASQLLVILSDGRNVSHEEEEVKHYLRQLKAMGVLTLFIIIDDLKSDGSGKSIVDIKRFVGPSGSQQLVNYMELFPFPYYVILRQLEMMPSILGNSLRQWFELVNAAAN